MERFLGVAHAPGRNVGASGNEILCIPVELFAELRNPTFSMIDEFVELAK
jgi:hypothetical protein